MPSARQHGVNVPPVYFLVALAAMALLDFVIPVFPLVARPYHYAGFAVMALAIGLIGWAALLFHRAGTGIVPFSPATALVARGPYRFTRNPMYEQAFGAAYLDYKARVRRWL